MIQFFDMLLSTNSSNSEIINYKNKCIKWNSEEIHITNADGSHIFSLDNIHEIVKDNNIWIICDIHNCGNELNTKWNILFDTLKCICNAQVSRILLRINSCSCIETFNINEIIKKIKVFGLNIYSFKKYLYYISFELY